MARKSKPQSELSTGIALGERFAKLEAGFQSLELFVQRRVKLLVLLAASAVMQTVGVPLSSKLGAVAQEVARLFHLAM